MEDAKNCKVCQHDGVPVTSWQTDIRSCRCGLSITAEIMNGERVLFEDCKILQSIDIANWFAIIENKNPLVGK